TTAAPTTAPPTTVAPTTDTTAPANPVPPEVQAAIIQACNTLASTLQPFGVDLSPLTLGCALVAQGQGSLLLSAFLSSPVLGCTALAGVAALANPTILNGCIAFAMAIQPYSSYIAGLIPT